MLYLIGMTPNSGVTFAQVQQQLGAHCHSFYRFMDWAWVVCSNEPANVWVERLRRYVVQGSVLVCRFDVSDHQGLMEREFWTWFNEHARH